MQKRESDRSDKRRKNHKEKSNKKPGIGRSHQEDPPSKNEQKRYAPGHPQDQDRSESGIKQPVRQARAQ